LAEDCRGFRTALFVQSVPNAIVSILGFSTKLRWD
jgi:hypothetical protein